MPVGDGIPGLTAPTPTSTGTSSGPRSRQSRRDSAQRKLRDVGAAGAEFAMAESAPAEWVASVGEGLVDAETSVLPGETEEARLGIQSGLAGFTPLPSIPLKIPPLGGLPA